MVFQSYELEQRRKIRDRNQNRNEMETGKGVGGGGGGGGFEINSGVYVIILQLLDSVRGAFCLQTNERIETNRAPHFGNKLVIKK